MASPATETAQKSASNPPQPAPSTTPAPTTQTIQPTNDQQPTSTQDDGLSRRPRDARLIHLILSAQGVHSYQERVPLQLLDFAYRYTSSVLADAFRLSSEGYASAPGAPTNSKRSEATDGSNITVNALRQAIASRQDYQFQGALPKEFMMEQAVERNRVALPKIQKSWGVQLPPEKYCLTGTGWSLRDLWEEDEVVDEESKREGNGDVRMEGAGDVKTDGAEEKDAMDSFEDVFGGGAQGDDDGDQEMAEA
ncbi:TFIID-31kDa-domain-containing protein, partial [Aureobasidium melanogenum]